MTLTLCLKREHLMFSWKGQEVVSPTEEAILLCDARRRVTYYYSVVVWSTLKNVSRPTFTSLILHPLHIIFLHSMLFKNTFCTNPLDYRHNNRSKVNPTPLKTRYYHIVLTRIRLNHGGVPVFDRAHVC